jgi:hypothetical protein
MTVLALPIAAPALFLIVDARPPPSGGQPVAVVAILAVYESLKHMHANRITQWLGIEPKDALMLRIDEALFGKALPLWMDSWTATWFQELMTFCYIWIYYLWPVALLSAAYLAHRDDLFRRLRLGLVFGLLGGYVLYIFVPVAGPLYLIGDRFQHPIPGHSRLETLFFDALRFNWDCFPSLHTAIPWLLTVLIRKPLPRWSSLVGSPRECRHALDLSPPNPLRRRPPRRLLSGSESSSTPFNAPPGPTTVARDCASEARVGVPRRNFAGLRRTRQSGRDHRSCPRSESRRPPRAGALVGVSVSRPLLVSGVCLAGAAFEWLWG